jgi:thioesterase domain-containing protein
MEFDLASVFGNPTVRELVSYLRIKSVKECAFDRVLALRRQGSLPPIFCLPPAGGLGWGYAGLLRELHPERPLYCLQSSGIADDAPIASSMEGATEEYLTLMRGIQPKGPYHLLGWSFGGLVAHMIACRLQEAGHDVRLLALLDAYPPQRAATAEESAAYTMKMTQVDPGILPSYFSLSPSRRRRITAVMENSARLSLTFDPRRFSGDILLITSSEVGHFWRSWSKHVSGQINVRQIDCGHLKLVSPGTISFIGRILEQYLQGAGQLVTS